MFKVQLDDRPSVDEICELKKTMSWKRIGEMYGVSGNTIKKWVRVAGGKTHPYLRIVVK